MLLRKLFAMHGLHHAAPDEGAGSGGGGETPDFDIDAASDSLAGELGLTDEPGSATPSPGAATGAKPSPETDEAKLKAEADAKAAKERAAAAAATKGVKLPEGEMKPKVGADGKPVLGADGKPVMEKVEAPKPAEAPKSWRKEMHEVFGKLPPEVQAYILKREQDVEAGFKNYDESAKYGKSLQDVISPYQPMLDAQGVKDHAAAVRYLMNAHYQLSVGSPEERTNFLARIAKNYGLDLVKAVEAAKVGADAQPSETEKALLARLQKLESGVNAQQQAQLEALQAKTAAEVEAFASDPAHPYFDEVADHITLLLRDPKISLKDAYEQAVWANPVTRAKEQARLQKEQEAALREAAEKEAQAALRAKGTRVRGAETDRASPENLGSMDETLRETFKEIQGRA